MAQEPISPERWCILLLSFITGHHQISKSTSTMRHISYNLMAKKIITKIMDKHKTRERPAACRWGHQNCRVGSMARNEPISPERWCVFIAFFITVHQARKGKKYNRKKILSHKGQGKTGKFLSRKGERQRK